MPADAHAGKWAYRVCKNAWIDEIRSRDVRQKYPQLVEEQSDVAHSAEHIAGSDQELNAVAMALDGLPAEQRMALSLVAIEGKTYAEAAEALEVPIGTIMSRVARARRQLVDVYGAANDADS
jgi:RNA polymerase sigma-70 factor (ECF subfamily)